MSPFSRAVEIETERRQLELIQFLSYFNRQWLFTKLLDMHLTPMLSASGLIRRNVGTVSGSN